MLTDDINNAELRILLVEDDDDDALLFQRAVGQSSHDIHLLRACNGQEAVDLLENSAPDILPELVVLDLNMPLMNGREFLTWLRADERFEDIQVIVLTTSTDASVLTDVRELGADAALSKDLGDNDVEALRQMIVDFWFHGSVRAFDPDEGSPL